VQPHEYERGGTAKLLPLFRPATGLLRAKGVLSASNAVLHPWLKAQLSEVLAEIEKAHPRAELPPEDERPPNARWETWLGHRPRTLLPPLRVVLVLDNLAGHHPKNAQEVIDWLEQTVAGWNKHPTPFVWNGKRRRRRERARLRCLAGSGAALAKGYSLAS
jgi:hypothetical protein